MEFADQRAITRHYVNWAKAIAAYEYTLISRNAAFDRWVNDGEGSEHISPAAKRGARLFVGKAGCIDCHSGPLLSDGKFHNIGIPQLGTYVPVSTECPQGSWCDCVTGDVNQPNNCLPWGARDGLRKLQSNRFRRDSFFSDDPECQSKAALHSQPGYADDHPTECDGRVRYYSEIIRARTDSTEEVLKGAWRTPSLRDVALTAPYMHNGMYKTLDEVVWHYNIGGNIGGDLSGRRAPPLKPLYLSQAEQSDLVEFLKTLNGAPLPPAKITSPALPAASPF
jgi:cytochrome c peroxidase